MVKKKITAIIAASTVAMNVSATKTVFADTINYNHTIGTVEGIENNQARAAMPTLNGITINKQLISRNYSKGVIIVPRYIVIHDTDNRQVGANAMANRNYFANHENANASAHYTVDQSNIIQCLEDNWRGWHVGDGRNPLINNSNTIGIELCVNADNNFDKTLQNGIALTRYLMQKYNIPAERVVRHYDASGKICPKMMIKDRPDLWTYFKSVISGGTTSGNILYTGKVINVSSTLNVRGSASGSAAVVTTLQKGSTVNIYGEENGWYKIAYLSYGDTKYGYVSKSYIEVERIPSSNGTSSNGNSNSGSNSNGSSVINKKGKVVNISTSLNVRNSASTNGLVLAYLKNGHEVTINYEENGWYNVTYDTNKTGFVSKGYISVINNEENSNGGNTSSGSNSNTGNNSSTSGNNTTNNNAGTTTTKKGKVTNVSTSLNVRSSASTNGSVVAQLKNGHDVTINYEQNGWYNITFDSNKTGFVSKSYISVINNGENSNGGNTSSGSNSNTGNNSSSSGNTTNNVGTTKKGKVINVSTSLNVRSSASTNGKVVAQLKNGHDVTINYEQNGWYNITFDSNKTGFVSKSYISVVNNTGSTNSNTSSGSTTGNTSSNTNNNAVTTTTKKGKVVNVSTNLNVRKGAGTNYSVVAYVLNNTDVEILSEQGSWYKIRLKDGREGYVAKQYISIASSSNSNNTSVGSSVSNTSKGKVVNVSTNLNVRKGAGTNYSVVAYLLPGSEVVIKNNTNGWYYIEVNVNGSIRYGYVKTDYIQIVK